MTDQAFIILVQTILALAVLAPLLMVVTLSQISLFVPETAETGSAEDVAAISLDLGARITLDTVLPLGNMVALYAAENVTPYRMNLLSGDYETCTADDIVADVIAFAAPVAPIAQPYPLRAALMLLVADLYVEGLFLIGRLRATQTAAQHAWATS